MCTPTPLAPHIYLEAGQDCLEVNLAWETHEKEILEFDLWAMTACVHPNMHQASEHIGNWASVRAFQHALRTANRDGFATLLRELPDSNGGLTFPDAARLCLDELDRFERTDTFGQQAVLTDAWTGAAVAERIEDYLGWFMSCSSSGQEFSVEADGSLCIRNVRQGTFFRSKEFAQRRAEDGSFIYTDLESAERYGCPCGIADHQTSEYPPLIKGIVRPNGASSHAYTTAALKRVFAASVEVNHPVSWR